MCGRSVVPNSRTYAELAHKFGVSTPMFNNGFRPGLAERRMWPGVQANVFFEWEDSLAVAPFTYGFDVNHRLYNARCETLEDRWAWREAYQQHRCVVPLTSFWEGSHEFTPVESEVFLAACIWGVLRYPGTPAEGEERFVFAMLTTKANPHISPYHGRMPVFMPATVVPRWIESDERRHNTLEAMVSYTEHLEMVA